MMDEARSWTDEDLIELWDDGYEQAEIARHTGLTRQRIGQRLARHGLRGKNPNKLPAAAAILSAVATVTSLNALAQAVSTSVGRLVQAIDRYDIREQVADQLRSNRQQQVSEARLLRQREYVAILRSIARQVRRTPTSDDLEQQEIFPMSLHQVFGSVQAAMLAAGLRPNRPGLPPEQLPDNFEDDAEVTVDMELLRTRADRLRKVGLATGAPQGVLVPDSTTVSTIVYYRSPVVVAWVLEEAGGICESCGEPGYETDAGIQFLEVHHVVALAAGGSDTVDNAVAVCETCHGKLHRWKHRHALTEELYAKLPRLKRLIASR